MKNIMLSAATIFAVGMLAVLPSAAIAADQTFSFDSPSVNYAVYNPTGFTGVTFNDASGVSIQGAFFGVAPPDGNQAAFIQTSFQRGVGTISFALAGLSVGTAYTTSFFAATSPDYGYSPTTNSPTTPITVSFDGTALGVYTATSVNFTQFTVPDFLATATTGTLTLSGTPAIYGTVNLDRVSIKASTTVVAPVPGAVPEPATWAMMAGGFGMIGSALRRRRPTMAHA